ncbi:MAG: DMT family transporter [Chitinivibrionales bacterium]
MNVLPTLSILLAASANCVGSVLVKYSSLYKTRPDSSNGVYWALLSVAFFIFGVSFPFYAYGMSKIHLSVAQPIFSVFTYVSIAIVAIFVFNEPYSIVKAFGLLLILIGVVIVARS